MCGIGDALGEIARIGLEIKGTSNRSYSSGIDPANSLSVAPSHASSTNSHELHQASTQFCLLRCAQPTQFSVIARSVATKQSSIAPFKLRPRVL
jgi:hypothetical protein